MGTIEYIFVSPRREAEMVSLTEVEAIVNCGLRGDRYAEPTHRKSPDYQLTLIEAEQVEAFCLETGLSLAPHEPRRNLVTRGIRLNDLCGKRFRVGSVELDGLDLCEPCRTMANRTHAEVLRFFVHRGGLRCRIVTGGYIRIGDKIETGA